MPPSWLGAVLVLVPAAVQDAAGQRSSPRTPPTPPSRPAAGAGAGCGRSSSPSRSRSPSPSSRSSSYCSSLPSRRRYRCDDIRQYRAILALYTCFTAERDHTNLPTARAARAVPVPAAHHGGEIADHLRVDRRTVRRYVDALQELGIPIEGQRGVGGGYRLRPGYRLPPLMLSDDEAVAVVLGLVAARRLGLDAGGEHPRRRSRRSTAFSRRRSAAGSRRSNHARVHRGGDHGRAGRRRDPAPARRCDPPPAPTAYVVHVVLRGSAAARAQPVRARRARGALVPGRARPRPRRAAHVPRRPDAPNVDDPGGWNPPPGGFDAVAHVARSLASVPWTWEVEVWSICRWQTSRRGSRRPSRSSSTRGADVLRMRVDSLDWMAGVLAGLGCDFASSGRTSCGRASVSSRSGSRPAPDPVTHPAGRRRGLAFAHESPPRGSRGRGSRGRRVPLGRRAARDRDRGEPVLAPVVRKLALRLGLADRRRAERPRDRLLGRRRALRPLPDAVPPHRDARARRRCSCCSCPCSTAG